jgi:hypothetical protein
MIDLSFQGGYFANSIETAKALEACRASKQKSGPRGQRVRNGYIDIDMEYSEDGKPEALILVSGWEMLLSEFIADYCPSLATLVDVDQHMTALFYCKTVDEIDTLVSCGADVDHIGRYDETRLDELLPSEPVDEQIFERLLHHGARIDWFNSKVDDLRANNDWRYDSLVRFRLGEQRCRNATKTYLHCLNQCGIFPRDIRMFMVKLLWRTRRWYDWSPECMERLAKRK